MDKKRIADLGKITIKIVRAELVGPSNRPSISRRKGTSESQVNEKAKKALLTHSVRELIIF